MIAYENIKPLLFKLEPETAHHAVATFLHLADVCPALFNGWTQKNFITSDRLNQTLFGREFLNPVGLAAGFDKNAEAIGIPAVSGIHAVRSVHSSLEEMIGVPLFEIQRETLENGVPAYILFEEAGLCKSRGEARRLISQGGGYLNGRKLQQFDQLLRPSDMENGALLLRAGKKRYKKVIAG